MCHYLQDFSYLQLFLYEPFYGGELKRRGLVSDFLPQVDQPEPDSTAAMSLTTGTDKDMYNFKYNATPQVCTLVGVGIGAGVYWGWRLVYIWRFGLQFLRIAFIIG